MLVTVSMEIVRLCGVASSEFSEEGKSHFETLEKDFFFLRGGWGIGACRMRGRGGGGGRVEESLPSYGDGGWDVNAKEDSVKDFRRVGMWTGFEGAVLGRAVGDEARMAKESLSGAGGGGIGSEFCWF